MAQQSVQWPRRMNATDAMFWFMDKIPEMRSTIGALVLLERAPSRERVRQEFERLAFALPRMRQRVVEVPFSLAPPEWIEDGDFDLDYHVRFLAVPEPGGLEDVLNEMSPLYATAFDRDRPLWEAYMVEGVTGGHGALFVKLHHCMVDGVGGTRMFEELLRTRQDTPPAGTRVVAAPRSEHAAALLWRAALYNLQDSTQLGRDILQSLWEVARHPATAFTAVQRGIATMKGLSSELATPVADSPLQHRRSLSRRLSTFDMSLTDLDAVRARLGATNNDLILTIVSGAMHRWHTSHGADVQSLRAMMPVSLRGSDEVNVGNRIGLLAIALPIGEPNPLQRLQTIQERTSRVKADQRAALYPLVARVMTALPLALAERLSRQQTSRANFVCTNVPGPQHTCYMAGEVIEKIYPYAPLVGDHPVAIALYSYRDMLHVGIDIDPVSMDDLSRFRDAIAQAYEEMLNVGRRAAVPKRPAPQPASRAKRARAVRRQAAAGRDAPRPHG